MIIVSGSEVDTYQRCEQAHWYSFGLALSPNETSMPLRAGILGHSVLEEYYRGKRAELSHQECIDRGMAVIADYAPRDDGTVLPIVTKRFLQYTDLYKNESWRVLDVEGVYSYPLGSGITYALTLDLLVEITNGPYKGEQAVVDHKWTYNFWTKNQVHMNSQVPRYIGTLKKLGSTAKIGFFNQIRYRPLKDESDLSTLFRRDKVEPTQVRMDNIMGVQKAMSLRIAERKLMGPQFLKNEAQPTLNKEVCKNCFFVDPCNIELDGRSPLLTLKTGFQPRTYGYSEDKLRRNLA